MIKQVSLHELPSKTVHDRDDDQIASPESDENSSHSDTLKMARSQQMLLL